ncbi:MAG: glycine cleavage system protein GcvH [Clostridiales bacterium]|nr:glycine cleavage system protein GcvH [Clostridiales bacterium]MCF8021092.1 glycine cleavage system protein GcvH [Clostridiales bacterium]
MSDDKKTLEELTFLNDIYYHSEHTWARIEGEQVRVGITDFAQDQLGSIIFIEIPEAGDAFSEGDEFGQAESAKTVSSLHMPVSGEVVSVNPEVEDTPETVNNDPYGDGWIIIVKPKDMDEVNQLLTRDGYINMLKES